MSAIGGQLHHLELWVPDLERSTASLGWLLTRLGWEVFQAWEDGRSWRRGTIYVVVEQSPAMTSDAYDRLRPGINHLAFHVSSRDEVDHIAREARTRHWTLMFADRHPFAGGPEHYAAYLQDVDGFEVELVATPDTRP